MTSYQFRIEPGLSTARLDLALVELAPQFSRRKIRKLIDFGAVYLNRKRVRIASRPVRVGDRLSLEYSEASLKSAQGQDPLGLDVILYENDDVIVINKPKGLSVQGERAQNAVTVLTALAKLRPDLAGRLGLVHRLDKYTTGCFALAKSKQAGEAIGELFRGRKVLKEYLALCHGLPKAKTFYRKSQLSNIGARTGRVLEVASGGKEAITAFECIRQNQKSLFSLIKCMPKTGRSHQLRVHLEALGYPIVGDHMYGQIQLSSRNTSAKPITQLLHAQRIRFSLKGKVIDVVAPIPHVFSEIFGEL
jgi:RluA family pseudouridine synthase